MKIFKKLVFFVLTVTMIVACQQEQRYFAESAETKTLEAGIAAYESGDWEKWKSHFADTAKIYVNSDESMSVDARMAQFKQTTPAWADYSFDKEKAYIEMVLDKEDETWVYFWGTHNGSIKATGKELSMPVHLAVQFKDGKIVEEHVFFDGTAMNKEMEAMNNMSADEKLIATNVSKLANAWIKNDMNSFNALTVNDIGRSVNGLQVVKSQKEYRDLIASNHAMLSDINIVTSDLMITGNKAYFKWTFSGKNTKDIEGMKATNKPVSINGIAIWTFNNEGKATYEEVYFDQNDINVQLGYTLTPPK